MQKSVLAITSQYINLEAGVGQQVSVDVVVACLASHVVPWLPRLEPAQTLAVARHPCGKWDMSAAAGTMSASSWHGICDHKGASCILHQPFPLDK
jgi:hypothetical protein